ncbi:STAS domain-containing protein [Streptomyces silvisoli]|uniref:STAS domain-containing protein n=1 Tax=Streptomyces silvisoli TaxID=3034235 RepID=UPI0023E2E0AC|nr:STAS domain-containing protein [Streptomyces silvisoli]
MRGQIDDDNADPVGRALAALVERSPTVIELDLSHLTHVTGPGAGAFYRLLTAAVAHHTAVTISGPNAQVQRDLHRTALNRFLVNVDASPHGGLMLVGCDASAHGAAPPPGAAAPRCPGRCSGSS